MKEYSTVLQQQINQTIAEKKSLNIDYLLQLVDKTYSEQQRYVQAIDGMRAGLWDWDIIANQCYFSFRWRQSLNYSDADTFESIEHWSKLIHQDDLNRVSVELKAHLDGTTSYFHTNHRIRSKENVYIWVTSSGIATRDNDNKPVRLIVTQVNVSSENAAEQELMQAAFYDKLTNLPNRSLFIDRLQKKIAKFKRAGELPAALLYIDLDRFKMVNDSLGHDAGDELLIAVSRRMELCLRPGDTAGRIGGDEFAVILPDIENNEHAISIANRIITEISKPYCIKQNEINISASIGVTIIDENSTNYQIVMKYADSAMYQAKIAGKSQAKMYINNVQNIIINRIQLEKDLKNSLHNNQLLIHYQPIIEFKSNLIKGFESLIRWNHPNQGIIAAKTFLPLAEDSDFIFEIGIFVMQSVCNQINLWRKKFKNEAFPWISVNIWNRQIIDASHVHNLIDIIDEARLDPGQLSIEFAENLITDRQQNCTRAMQQFKKSGLHLCLDNFGTGHASLDALCTYPFDYLKIDQTYVSKMMATDSKKGTKFLSNIVTLARQLNVQTIATGVEGQQEYDMLKVLNCDLGQGYFFLKPLPLSDIDQLLANQLK